MAKIGINIATGSLQKEEIIVGIDLGTTNSLIAIIHPENKQAVALKETDGHILVPSVIYFNEMNEAIVGIEAKKQVTINPRNTIFSVKRLLGKSFKDVIQQSNYLSYKIIDDDKEEMVKVQVGNKFYSPVELSSLILKELKNRAEHILKTPVQKAVITVPAYFNDAQRQATRDAGKLAGLDVLRIVSEPTAASLAYGIGLHKNEHKTVAVYDLGGGTFDISILNITNGIFEVLATHGDTNLGGDDFDRIIAEYWQKQYDIKSEFLIENPIYAQTLRVLAEEAKKHLSLHQNFDAVWMEKPISISYQVFENLSQVLVEKTLQYCKTALQDAKISVQNIDEVLLVGGATRMLFVKKSISKFFDKKANDSLNPDEVVALGAAIHADILAGNNRELLLLDVTPLSLGVETSGGLMDVLIARNTRIPVKASRQYTTQKDGQSGIKISVYQGERDLVKDNRKLGEFILSGIPSMPAGFPKVDITFLVNADGITQVSAYELRSGVKQSIELKPQYGLTDAAIEQMLEDSLKHAKDDIYNRALIEAKTQAQQMIDVTKIFLNKNVEHIFEIEIKNTEAAINALNILINNGTKNEIQQATENLNTITTPYAERIMNTAINRTMKGKQI